MNSILYILILLFKFCWACRVERLGTLYAENLNRSLNISYYRNGNAVVGTGHPHLWEDFCSGSVHSPVSYELQTLSLGAREVGEPNCESNFRGRSSHTM